MHTSHSTLFEILPLFNKYTFCPVPWLSQKRVDGLTLFILGPNISSAYSVPILGPEIVSENWVRTRSE